MTRGEKPPGEGACAAVREITAILVSWEDSGELEPAVASLAAARRIAGNSVETSLVVVQNGGDPVREKAILALWPGARVLLNETNRGFGPAANQAARQAPGDVLLFLNPDARAEGDSFSEIARGLGDRPEAAALAPRLIDRETPEKGREGRRLSPPDREDQFTFQLRRLPGLLADARELLLVDHLFPNNPWRRSFRYADRDRESAFEVEQPAAAVLAVRTAAFWRAGGFDEAFVPAWFEDVDLCERLRREGAILYWPHARFRHRGGVSAARLGYPRFLPLYYGNALLYRKKHYGMPARLAYRALLSAGMMLRLSALPFRPVVPRSRGEAARAYLSTLRLALQPATGNLRRARSPF